MKQYAHMKKNPNKLFEILGEDASNVRLMDLSNGEEKTIKTTTFRKSYKYGKGDVQGQAKPSVGIVTESDTGTVKKENFLDSNIMDVQHYAIEQALVGVTETQEGIRERSDTSGRPKTTAEPEKA